MSQRIDPLRFLHPDEVKKFSNQPPPQTEKPLSTNLTYGRAQPPPKPAPQETSDSELEAEREERQTQAKPYRRKKSRTATMAALSEDPVIIVEMITS